MVRIFLADRGQAAGDGNIGLVVGRVVSDLGTALQARRDISILGATNEPESEQFKKSGLIMASVTGDVTMPAGGTYQQVGSNVSAPTGDVTARAAFGRPERRKPRFTWENGAFRVSIETPWEALRLISGGEGVRRRPSIHADSSEIKRADPQSHPQKFPRQKRYALEAREYPKIHDGTCQDPWS